MTKRCSIEKKVHTVATQYHCMKITKRTVNLVYPGRTPIDFCNQPLDAITKEILWRCPEDFGASFYFTLHWWSAF